MGSQRRDPVCCIVIDAVQPMVSAGDEEGATVGRLDGEVAIITGSTSGLGKVTAGLFVSEGAQVIVTGRDATRGAAVVDDLTVNGGDAAFVAADLSTEDGCRALVAGTVEHFG